MDNENAIKTEEENGDKKAAKKAAKLAKREEKAKKREEKQRQKLAKAGASPEEIERAPSTKKRAGAVWPSFL